MTVDVAQQLRALCGAVLLGGGLGLLYDLMRVVRRRVPALGGGLDLLFWLLATAGLFLFSHRAWGGRVRLYGALFCLLGGGAYFWGLSPYVLGTALFLTGLGEKLAGLVLFPLKKLLSIFQLENKMKKLQKISFLSGKKGV